MENTLTARKTLGSVLSGKLLDLLEQTTLGTLLTLLSLSLVAGLASSLVIDLSWSLALLGRLVRFHDFAALKVAGTFALVFNAKRIILFIHAWLLSVIELLSRQTVVETIEGIPTTELLDWLFTRKHFKQAEIEREFQISRHRYTALAKKMKEVGLLVSGENNAYVLNPEYSRRDVASILRHAKTADDLQPLLRKVTDHHFTSEPSAREITERVASALSPAPSFKVRQIAEIA